MDYTISGTPGSGGAPVTGFIFPILKATEIQQCMHELGTELTNDELNDPAHHKEKLRKIFTFLVRFPVSVDSMPMNFNSRLFSYAFFPFPLFSWKYAPVNETKTFCRHHPCSPLPPRNPTPSCTKNFPNYNSLLACAIS
jgi:Nuf2 family